VANKPQIGTTEQWKTSEPPHIIEVGMKNC